MVSVSFVSGAQHVPDESIRITDPSGNFDRYAYVGSIDSSSAQGDIEFAIYKVGDANSEIALTYLTFGEEIVHESRDEGGFTSTQDRYAFALYGQHTSPFLIAAMAGSASYRGVVYGRAAGPDGLSATVGGTSLFNVDFSSDAYSGELVLDGSAGAGGGIDFGTWTFSGLVTNSLLAAELTNGTPHIGVNEIQPFLFGPNGEELGATFQFSTQTDFMDTDYFEVAGITIATKE